MQHEIGIILRIKNLKKTKQQIDALFGKKTRDPLNKYRKGLGDVEKRTRGVGSASKKLGSSFKRLTGQMFSALAVFRLFNRGFTTTLNLIREAGELERASNSFERTVGNLEGNLPRLREATQGVVEDFKLLKTATRAVTEGLGQKNLAKVFEIATSRAQQLSISVPEAIQTTTKAITRLDESALRTLGILTKQNKEYIAANQLLGQFGAGVSSVAQLEYRRSFVLRELNKIIEQNGKAQEDNLMILNRARAAYQNLRRSLGNFAATVFRPLIEGFTTLANSIRDTFSVLAKNKSIVETARTVALLTTAFTAAVGGIAVFKLAMLGLTWTLSGFTIPVLALVAGLAAISSQTKNTGEMFKKAGLAIKTFFSLLGSYDAKTGTAQVLKRDKESLGEMYNIVVKAAKAAIVLGTAFKGAFRGILDIIKPVANAIGLPFKELFDSMEKGEPLSKRFLNNLEKGMRDLIIVGGRVISTFTTILGLITSIVGAATLNPVVLGAGIGMLAKGGLGMFASFSANTSEEQREVNNRQAAPDQFMPNYIRDLTSGRQQDDDRAPLVSPARMDETTEQDDVLKKLVQKFEEQIEATKEISTNQRREREEAQQRRREDNARGFGVSG